MVINESELAKVDAARSDLADEGGHREAVSQIVQPRASCSRSRRRCHSGLAEQLSEVVLEA